jgi:hypothetical protein
MDNSFLSRMLIWYQDMEHYKIVTAVQEDEIKEITTEFSTDIWLSIFDFCTSQKSKFDHKRVQEIYETTKYQMQDLSEPVKGIYNSRYKHHIFCLADGLTKLYCLTNKKEEFEADEVVYQWLKDIWSRMIKNWKKGIENVGYGIREDRFYGE